MSVREVSILDRAQKWMGLADRGDIALGGHEDAKIFLLAALVVKLDEVGKELAALNAKAGKLVEEGEKGDLFD